MAKKKEQKIQKSDPHFFEYIANLYCMHNGLKGENREVVMGFGQYIDITLSAGDGRAKN